MKKRPKINKVCLQCKKKFIVLWARRQRKYCSHPCSSADSKNKKHWWHAKSEFKKGHKSLWTPESIQKAALARTHKMSLATRLKHGYPAEPKKYKRYHHQCWTKSYRKWRQAVFEREDYTCQECGIRGGYLIAHHIEEWSKNPEKRFIISNGTCLCKPCHKSIHFSSRLNEKLYRQFCMV